MRGGVAGQGLRGGLAGIDQDPPDGTIVTADLADLAVTTGKLAAGAVTDAKLRNSAALSVLGRAANSAGSPADIAAGSNLQYFGRRSNALGFFSLTEDDIGVVLSRQQLLADAQDITIALNGDADERYWIHGYGPTNGGGNPFTLRINDAATAVVYGYMYTTAGAAVAAAADGAGFLYDDGSGFDIILDAKTIANTQRGGICDGWSRSSTTIKARWSAAFGWNNKVDNITQLVIRGFDSDTFKQNFLVIVRKLKFT